MDYFDVVILVLNSMSKLEVAAAGQVHCQQHTCIVSLMVFKVSYQPVVVQWSFSTPPPLALSLPSLGLLYSVFYIFSYPCTQALH